MEPTLRIAFVCPRMTNTFSRTIWYSLQEAATTLGVRLTAVLGGDLDHPRRPTPARRVYDLLDVRNFDGVLLHTSALSRDADSRLILNLLEAIAPLPVVSLGEPLAGFSSVATDQAGAIKAVVDHLYHQHGYRRFAFVAGPVDHGEARIRKQAFVEALADLGVSADSIEFFPGDYRRESGAQAVHTLSGRLGSPVALMCANDQEALGALAAAKALGIGVPSPLAITGFDDVDLAPLHEPSLTSVGQPLIGQAGRALARLAGQIRGTLAVGQEVDPGLLCFRESCGCQPKPLVAPDSKAALVLALMATQTNVTASYLAFLREWISDYLTAFEYYLETGNGSVLKTQWSRYYGRRAIEQERGVPFRRLFAGLETLYSHHPNYPRVALENVTMAGAAESRKGTRDDQNTRNFFFLLHGVEVLIGQINDRAGLAALPFSQLHALGLSGLAIVRFGAPPILEYFHSRWAADGPPAWGAVDYPALLPPEIEAADPPSHRLVVALTAENSYLGYAVFWTEGHESFVCDLLANQISGALQRIELFEKVREHRESLETSLEETRKMQTQLVETEKVASLGRLVAGVAHEINTPLGTGITGTSFLLEKLGEVRHQFEAGGLARSGLQTFFSQGQEALDGVLRNLMKAGELIQAFKGLGLDHGEGEWKPIRLKSLFGDLCALYEGELTKRGIRLRFEVPDEHVLVYSQPSALVQVTGELLENAMDHAFVPGFSGDPQVLLQVEVQADLLRLAVTDNGRGLSEDERRHIFEPLYTTRRPQGHAGLGLHLAFQLITRTLGGRMTVASETGAGSCFLCLIPLKNR